MDQTKFKIKGSVTFYQDGKKILSKLNAVQPGSTNIIRRCLAGFPVSHINSMAALYNDTSLASLTFRAGEIELINQAPHNKIKFTKTFPRGTFTGTFNKLQLKASVGVFSELTGFSHEISAHHDLNVEWILEIIIV